MLFRSAASSDVDTADKLDVEAGQRSLYKYFLENGWIEPIREFDDSQLHITPRDVLARLQSGDASWETMVPPEVSKMIKARGFFGYRGSAAA